MRWIRGYNLLSTYEKAGGCCLQNIPKALTTDNKEIRSFIFLVGRIKHRFHKKVNYLPHTCKRTLESFLRSSSLSTKQSFYFSHIQVGSHKHRERCKYKRLSLHERCNPPVQQILFSNSIVISQLFNSHAK